jgi:hypothetical protein
VFPVLLLAAVPTYHRDVEPILQNRCQVCHHPGAVAPFSLLTFADARDRAETIREAVAAERMPPWFADPHFGNFANDRRLTAGEKRTLLSWIDLGTIEGDKKDAPPPKIWEDGWMIGKPDLILEMPATQVIPASGVVDYQMFFTPVPWTEDRWITAVEIRPSDRSVVHHAQFCIDDFSKLFANYDPGVGPLVLPPDTAFRFPAGRKVFWFMHYTPNGKATTDRTRIGFRFWKGDGPPKHVRYFLNLVNRNIDIPPGSPDTLAEYWWTLEKDTTVLSITPHMHLRGKDFRLEVVYPDGREEVPLVVPRFDFYWQTCYEFREPIRAPKGTKLHFVSHYDNSKANPNNPDPSKRVLWGPQSWNEMQTLMLDCYGQPKDDGLDAKVPDKQQLPTPQAAAPVKNDQPAAPGDYRWFGLLGVIPLAVLAGLSRRKRSRPRPAAGQNSDD